MNIDDFAKQLAHSDVRISISSQIDSKRIPATDDALFHLPLLSLAILVLASRKDFTTAVVGNWVTRLLAEQFVALRRTSGALHSSLTLRRRSADALAYLEAVGLVVISNDHIRSIGLTELGKRKLRGVAGASNDGGLLYRQLVTNRQRVESRGSLRGY